MQRRRFLQAAAVAGVSIASATTIWLNTGHTDADLSIAGTLKKLAGVDLDGLQATGAWSPGKTFAHLAQSIEFSMSGFPQHESDLFKATLGATAFSVFAKKGRMSHGLSEPIPGAPALRDDVDGAIALARLRTALLDFESFSGSLQPHFAYGDLSKTDYALAHVLHVNNHWQEFHIA